MFEKIYYDDSQLEQLYKLIMSRLPDISKYKYCKSESSAGRDVWKSIDSLKVQGVTDDGYGRITIEENSKNKVVSIRHYREWGGALIENSNLITYDIEKEEITSHGICRRIDFEINRQSNICKWGASLRLWSAVVEKLTKVLPRN
jgi:hypothetical protein